MRAGAGAGAGAGGRAAGGWLGDEIESCLILFVPLFILQSAYVCLLSLLSVGMKLHL